MTETKCYIVATNPDRKQLSHDCMHKPGGTEFKIEVPLETMQAEVCRQFAEDPEFGNTYARPDGSFLIPLVRDLCRVLASWRVKFVDSPQTRWVGHGIDIEAYEALQVMEIEMDRLNLEREIKQKEKE